MGLLQLLQLLLVLDPVLFHLAVLQLLLQGFCLALEGLGFNVLALDLALLLPADGVLTALGHAYIASQSWLTSRSLPSLVFWDLGEVMFLPVVGLLPGFINIDIITISNKYRKT